MADPRDKKVAILGLGLMGGSLGLALTRGGFTVSGWDEKEETVAEAYNIGAINRLPSSFQEAVSGVKFVFAATPVGIIPGIIRQAIAWADPETIFSDLGSIKESIIEQVFSFLPSDQYYVPGHPLTGSEQQGLKGADPFLFQNAAYILVAEPRTPVSALERVTRLLQTTGAHLMTLTAAEHDRIVAMVSHLPHLLAATLAKTAGLAEEEHPGTLDLAAGGFRDTTRIAMGSPEVWEGILLGNGRRILEAITSFQKQLDIVKQLIAGADKPGLTDYLGEAREVRSQIPAKNKGFLTLLYEMVVTIEDRPGAIEEVIRHLAKAGLNIKDIEILRVREGEGGTLRLALENSLAVDQGVKVLEDKGFKVRRR